MQTRALLLLAVLGLSAGMISTAEAQNVPAYVTAAVNDANRPAADKVGLRISARLLQVIEKAKVAK